MASSSGADMMEQRGIKRSLDPTRASSSSRAKIQVLLELCDRVYSLYEPEGQLEVEVVFIHGLSNQGLGDIKDAFRTTWLANDGSNDCWPQTWLVDEFPKARILSVSYDAERALKPSTLGTMDLYSIGESLIQEMVLPGVEIGQSGCPVVFVCHCLGGLVAKQVVVMAHSKFRRDKNISKLLQNVKAFFFYATPHGGSSLVKMTKEVGRLNSDFESIRQNEFCNKWRFQVVAEAHATTHSWYSSSKIVEEYSARYIYDHVLHVAADHFNVCRPKCHKSTSFLSLTACIAEVVSDYKCSQAKVMKLPSMVVDVDDKLSMMYEKLEKLPIIGLVGVGGIGKTTLSKVMYNLKSGGYDKSCYLEDVRSCTDMVIMHKKLLRELCGDKWEENEDLEYHLEKIKRCIMNKKVLVVVDDVWTRKSLEDLGVVDAFKNGKNGSRLVITSRDLAILRDLVCSPRENKTYEREIVKVVGLKEEQAMELFSHYAFFDFDVSFDGDDTDIAGFKVLAQEIVKACGGLPLSLEVIGQHLRKQNYLLGDDRLQMWRDALERLRGANALHGHVDEDERLWRKLRISYDYLEDGEKKLFLDCACILCDMKGMEKNTIVRICNSFARLQTLIDCSLLNLVVMEDPWKYATYFANTKYKLAMHDQLRDLGRKIVKDEAKKDVQKQTHVWEESQILQLVETRKGSKILEGLSWSGRGGRFSSESKEFDALDSETIQGHVYPQMRLVNLSSSSLCVLGYVLRSSEMKPSEMHWLCIEYTFLLKEYLGVLDRRFKQLQVLQLRCCPGLYGLPLSIGELTALKELNVTNCEWLLDLPDEIGNLGQLLKLDVSGCSIEKLPSTLGNLKQLKVLNLSRCGSLMEIPASAGKLAMLECLLLDECDNLHTMCEFETNMPRVAKLNLSGCRRLDSFKSLGRLCGLQALNMRGCAELHIPNAAECLVQWSRLQYLNLVGCPSMTRGGVGTPRKGQFEKYSTLPRLEHLELSVYPGSKTLPWAPCLKFLKITKCWGDWEFLESFGKALGDLAHLQVLRLRHFSKVPECLGKLTQLQKLIIQSSSIDKLPEDVGLPLPLQTLDLKWCAGLMELPECVGHLPQLQSLNLLGCFKLERLPESLAALPRLARLNLDECYTLKLEEGQNAILKLLHGRGCSITLPSGQYFPSGWWSSSG